MAEPKPEKPRTTPDSAAMPSASGKRGSAARAENVSKEGNQVTAGRFPCREIYAARLRRAIKNISYLTFLGKIFQWTAVGITGRRPLDTPSLYFLVKLPVPLWLFRDGVGYGVQRRLQFVAVRLGFLARLRRFWRLACRHRVVTLGLLFRHGDFASAL